MKILTPFSRGNTNPDPDDQFRAIAPENLAPRARQELARLRMQCAGQTQPYPGQCDDCPGRSHPRCCWNTEDYETSQAHDRMLY